jgi:hypothetical protein
VLIIPTSRTEQPDHCRAVNALSHNRIQVIIGYLHCQLPQSDPKR